MKYIKLTLINCIMLSLSLASTSGYSADLPCSKTKDAFESIKDIVSNEKMNRNFPDFQVEAIDYSKIDPILADKLKALESENLKIERLIARASDYKIANAGLKSLITAALNNYILALTEIRKDIINTLSPYYSKIKALKEAASNDNTNTMNKVLEEELRRLTVATNSLQKRNQERYDNAINGLLLNDILKKSIWYEGMPYMSKNEIDSYLKSDQVKFIDNTVLNKIDDYEYKEGATIEYSKYNIDGSFRLSLTINNEEKMYCLSGISISGKKKYPRYQGGISKDAEEFALEFKKEQNSFKSNCLINATERLQDLNPLSGCRSVACAELLTKDILEWREYASQFNQSIDISKILDKNSFIQKKRFWLSSSQESYNNKPIVSTALLNFAKTQLNKPSITPNQENNLIDIGGEVIVKVAGSTAGLAAGFLAAPALVLDVAASGIVMFAKLLDTRMVYLSIDLQNTEINESFMDTIYKPIKTKYSAKLPTALFEKNGSDSIFDSNQSKNCAATISDKNNKKGNELDKLNFAEENTRAAQ